MGGPLTQTTNDALAVVGVVRSGPRIAVDQTILERAVASQVALRFPDGICQTQTPPPRADATACGGFANFDLGPLVPRAPDVPPENNDSPKLE